MFLDKVKIVCKAGNGGDGCISFRREKYVPNGGPDGGDGGKGGNIIFKATAQMTNLSEFRYKKVFRADNGDAGSGNNRYGKSAKDLVNYVKDKGEPVLTDAANAVREKAIETTKAVLEKLENTK